MKDDAERARAVARQVHDAEFGPGIQLAEPAPWIVNAMLAFAEQPEGWPADAEFKPGDLVMKKGRASWRGHIRGWYRTELTALGYAVESMYEPGSVQIYPASALSA